MIVKTVKLSEKGQVAIPIEIREEAGLHRGDELMIIEQDGKILLTKAKHLHEHIKDEFKDLRKHSEAVAKKLWSNEKDEIWNKL